MVTFHRQASASRKAVSNRISADTLSAHPGIRPLVDSRNEGSLDWQRSVMA